MSRLTVCLDFDGVIKHPYTHKFVPGAAQFIVKLLNHGARIYVHSVRKDMVFMEEWMNEEFYQIYGGQQANYIMSMIILVDEKPNADIFLDDKGMNFSGQWPEIATLQTFKPWWKETGK